MKLLNSIFFKTFSALLLFFFLLPGSYAQLKEVDPSTEGFSAERLQKIDRLLNSYTGDGHKVAGTVALVARHGKIIYYKAAGYNDIEAGKKMQRDDMFRIASQTKSVTGVAAMILYEEGKFLLDDPISKYLPEFKNMQVLETFNAKDTTYTTVQATKEITIKNLMTHTSGIDYAVIGSPEAKAIYAKLKIPVGFEIRNITLEEGMKMLAQAPLMFQPGTQYRYGLSIDVLGYLVEKVSGMSLNDFMEQRIFKPLGMNDTYFYIPEAKQSRLAKTYKFDENGNKVENYSADTLGGNSIYPLVKGTYYSGGGGLSSTAKDYVTFLQMLANGGEYNGVRILSPSTVRLMTMNQIDKNVIQYSKDDLGLTFNIATEEGGASSFPWSPGTYDWGGYWGSNFWVDPQSGIVAQIWSQDPGIYFRELSRRFFVMVYSALVNP
ncbi:MAG: beta-lactamase family protein [Chitinophagaceae bacterium]|nr:beta-lactamase family protein [Chitinophagaceae bacterium]